MRPGRSFSAIERYVDESNRLTHGLGRRLADREFVAGEYSIADTATFPWIWAAKDAVSLDGLPRVQQLGLDATRPAGRGVRTRRPAEGTFE